MSIVYTTEGRAARVVAELPDGRKVVELAYGDEDELHFSGKTEIVGRVFDDPPTESYHKEITKLEARQKELLDKLHALRSEVSDAERTHKERIANLKQYEPLKFIEEFLDGKLTHYVLVNRYNGECIRISTPAEEVDTESRWEKKQKLLCLFGVPRDRELSWWLENERVYPFTCLEDAKAKATALLEDVFKKVRSEPFSAARAIASARAIGMPVPDDLLTIAQKYRLQNAQTTVDEARKKLAEAEKALAAATGGAA